MVYLLAEARIVLSFVAFRMFLFFLRKQKYNASTFYTEF